MRPRWRRTASYRRLVDDGVVASIVEDYASRGYAPRPPVRHHLNKADGRKKVVFTFAPEDDLLFKGLNLALQPHIEGLLSPLCHSFRPGRGPRSAYRSLLAIPDLDRLACLHVDVRDFFNSIPVERVLEALPAPVVNDRPLHRLLSMTLRDPRVISDGAVVEDAHKGVMAGTPLAPLLSNLYLRRLDAVFESSGVPYLRYADDMVVFTEPSEIERQRTFIEEELLALGLELNRRKTRISAPGMAWEFLGFRYERGALDVAPNTAGKLRRRVRRIARRARVHGDPCAWAVRRLNRRLYGVGGGPADFSWAGWFFPLLSGDRTLHALDSLIQAQLRYAVTGRHEKRNHSAVSYRELAEAGYTPLVSAYHAYRDGVGLYSRLLATRTFVRI
jgi:RNA-directed DNA polymerase